MKYKDFDTIIILDAMRADYGLPILESTLSGTGDTFNSHANTTWQWYLKWWATPNEYTLICENPMPWVRQTDFAHENFARSRKAFRIAQQIDPLSTLQLFERLHPQKTLLHFLPPHLPFIFGSGAALCKKMGKGNIYNNIQSYGQKHGWGDIRTAYRDQITSMALLLYEHAYLFEGDVLITADHGELLGFDDWQYDHPPKATGEKAKILQTVPWFIWTPAADILEQRLAHLGYN